MNKKIPFISPMHNQLKIDKTSPVFTSCLVMEVDIILVSHDFYTQFTGMSGPISSAMATPSSPP